MARTFDVAVLGGGIAGCATAYYLAREGAAVVVVERGGLANAASGFALGVLNPLVGSGIPGPMADFAMNAFNMHLDLWPELQAVSEVDFQARRIPHLQVATTDTEVDAFRAEAHRWNDFNGFSAEWVEPRELREMEPRLAEDIGGGVLLNDLAILDSYRFTLALAQAAERHGADMAAGEAVGLRSDNNRVTSVITADGTIDCNNVVVALGPWSGIVNDWLGLDVPISPLKGQILYLEGFDTPFRYHVTGPAAIVQKSDGMAWVSSTEEDAGFDLTTSPQARDYLTERAARVVPSVIDLRLIRQTACLRPITPDRLPVVGLAPGWDNVYLATGAGKKGILLGPAMGQAVADLVVQGMTDVPINGFEPGRFSE